jgi:hypothetical protein
MLSWRRRARDTPIAPNGRRRLTSPIACPEAGLQSRVGRELLQQIRCPKFQLSRSLASLLIVCCALGIAAPATAFRWRAGTLNVPSGFREAVRDYKEGTVTTLSYADESRIILQQGGMMRIPLLQDKHPVRQESETSEKLTRAGVNPQAGTFWREDDFKRKPPAGHVATWLDLFPPNIAYDHVPQVRKREFDDALDSFKLN